jgi:chitin synthase
VFLPFITFIVALYVVQIATLIIWKVKLIIYPEKREIVGTPESLLLLVPCYNESKEELQRSLDSLVAQKHLKAHPLGIVIICDGRVRGPGMTETTADCLLNQILTEKTSCITMAQAYLGWDKTEVDIILQRGFYKGIPYMCIVKTQNRGKRDGIILARSFGK